MKSKKTDLPGAFTGKSCKLYVRVHLVERSATGEIYTNRVAVYSSIEAYNSRSEIPYYDDIDHIAADYQQEITIDPVRLKIDLAK